MTDSTARRRLLQAAAALALTPTAGAAPVAPTEPQPGPALTGNLPTTSTS